MPHPLSTAEPPAGAAPSFRKLLYRYWFFGWLFKDVNRADLFERNHAWRHNQAQARWLPTYLRRWAILTLLCYLIGLGLEHGLGSPVMSSLLYVQAALGVVFNAMTSVLLLGLKVLPAPL